VRRSRLSIEQFVAVLKEAELGMTVQELIRIVGTSARTFCCWKQQYEKSLQQGHRV